MIQSLQIPTYVLIILTRMQRAGYDAYVVGGSVRDALMNRTPQDWDITTNATPEQIQEIWGERSFYDNSFGTVGVVVRVLNNNEERNEIVHVTTYRSDGEYSDFRRPDTVVWGKNIRDDLERRDFTINAIALQVTSQTLISSFETYADLPERMVETYDLQLNDYVIVDPYGGLVDLHKQIIRAVGDPWRRFSEDALRMMRAVRFYAQLGFDIDAVTSRAIAEKSENITFISGERIRDELWKLLASDRAYEGIKKLDEVGLLQYIFPELVAGRGLDQRGHHIYDVFEHSLLALKFCPSADPLVRLATLLHDIGKPASHEVRDGINTFYNHDIIGGKMVRAIASRLHLSKKDRERLITLVRYHMFSVDTIQTDAAVRRFIRKVGLDNIQDMIDLRIGDRLGSGTAQAEGWRLKEFRKRIETLLMPTFTVKDLVIDGRDVMRILSIPPGPKVGEVLNTLFEEVLDDPAKNTVEYLSRRVISI